MPRLEPPVRKNLAVVEFLDFEPGSQEKHEFIQGQIVPMAGGTPRHNRLAVRLGSLLENPGQNTRCLVAIADTLAQAVDALYDPNVMPYWEQKDHARV